MSAMIATDSFTADASGAYDPYVVPTKAKGANRLFVQPPVGHAWSFKFPALTSTVFDRTMDQALDVPMQAVVGAVALYVANDTGTGTFEVLWSRE